MKERMLTVLVPIRDSDATAVSVLPPVSTDNLNVIYKHSGVYKRLTLNVETGQYVYQEVVDREFPYIGKPLEIFNFTYDAERMGHAPTISAQGVMWFADKDVNGNDVTLENLWLERSNDCHVVFNGENFYLKQVPTSSKDEKDARYKYDIDFISERVVLENIYLYDVVQPFITERPVSESSSFSFYGDVAELAKRINASLLRSGLASLVRKTTYYYVPSGGEIGHLVQKEVPYLTYEQWNGLGYKSISLVGVVFDVYEELVAFIEQIYTPLHGNYQSYLFSYIYENTDGTYTTNGYICIIGKDKTGANVSSEEKLITFENNTIHEALQQMHDTFGLQYYITKEKDSNGDFTGNTLIMIADCEHDFADMDGADFVRDNDGIPTTEHPWDYGVDNELLSKEKTNTTDKIITRITGVGSSENIPWYYPNPTADGWIKPTYTRSNVHLESYVDYPISEEDNRYEKYLKNRIGDRIYYGRNYSSIKNINFIPEESMFDDYHAVVTYEFLVNSNSSVEVSATNSWDVNNTVVSCVLKRLVNGEYITVSDADLNNVFANGGICAIEEGSYKVIYDFTFVNRPTVIDDVTYYWYPEKETKVYFLDSWPLLFFTEQWALFTSTLLGVLPLWIAVVGIPGVVEAAIINYFSSGFTVRRGSFLSTNPNLKYRPGFGDVKKEGWYDQNNNIVHPTDPEEGSVVYAFKGGEGVKTLGVDNVMRIGYGGSETIQVTPFNETSYSSSDVRDVINYLMNYVLDRTGGGNKKTSIISKIDNVQPTVDDFVTKYFDFTTNIYENTWAINSKGVILSDYGMEYNGDSSPVIHDTIEFRRVKYITPQPTLMPEIYIKTDGERRFYNAVNYPLATGVPDTMIGEEESDGRIINPIYYKEGTTTHFDFENEYIKERPHEHIETFEDVKPTIKGQINTVDGRSFRVDVVEEFAYDMLDNDEVWESNDGGNVSGEYKHPYFFAKLRPLGFNIFDLALQDDMVLSLTTGSCGACNFKIGVDENTKKNPVQIWEYDVYGGSSYENRGQKLFSAGDIRRHIDTSSLYYDKTGDASGYTHVDSVSVTPGFLVEGTNKFVRRVYSAADVVNGAVGSLKQEGKNHFDGDVVTNGKFINSQQDTSDNYVWVALMKDTDTYGVIMPSARPDYGDGNFSVYIRPKSISDVHTGMSTDSEDEENADKFVLTNIRMPQIYLRRAERELSKKIVSYMYENNYQKFNFSIGLSRIFLGQNTDADTYLNENSVVYVNFNGKTYRQYVKHYTYRMSKDVVLPEISVDMNEELSVFRTKREQDEVSAKRIYSATTRDMMRQLTAATDRLSRNTVGKNDDTIIGGNIVSRDAVTSFGELHSAQEKTGYDLFGTQVDLQVNHYTKDDFVVDNNRNLKIGDDKILMSLYNDEYNIKRDVYDEATGTFSPTGTGSVSFNVALQADLAAVENTVFHRLGGQVATDTSPGCNHDVLVDSSGNLFWYSSTASAPTPYISNTCPTSIFIQ